MALLWSIANVQAQSEPPAGVLITSKAIAVSPRHGKVYVVDESRSAVWIIDVATNSSQSVRVGAVPDALAVNEVTGRVYVANSADGTVSILDGEKNTVLATVNAGPHPYTLAQSEATNKLYVTNTFSDKVAVIDGATNTTSLLKIGSADNVVVNPRTQDILFLGYEDAKLRILNGTTGSVEKRNIGEHVWGMAINGSTGAAYITRIVNSEVVEVDADLKGQATFQVGAIPCAVAVNEKTNMIYVANYGDDTVTILDGTKRKAVATVKVGNHPQAIAVDTKTNLIYVANTHSNNVTVIDGDRQIAVATFAAGKNPFAITASPDARKVYVANLSTPPFTVVDLEAGDLRGREIRVRNQSVRNPESEPEASAP